jgi:hypothetical protein
VGVIAARGGTGAIVELLVDGLEVLLEEDELDVLVLDDVLVLEVVLLVDELVAHLRACISAAPSSRRRPGTRPCTRGGERDPG